MKFKELLEVLHPYTDINIETEDLIAPFKTSKPGLLKGNHQYYLMKYQNWDVTHVYPDHSSIDGSHIVVRLEEPSSVHDCFFESVDGDNLHDYCIECGKSIFK